MSNSEDENFDTVVKLPRFHQRKQRRKIRTRQKHEEGEEPPIIRGLWVQEIDWLKSADRETISSADIIPPPPQFTDSASDSCSCAEVCDYVRRSQEASQAEDQSIDIDDTSSSDHRGGSDSDDDSDRTHESDKDSSYCVDTSKRDIASSFDLLHMPGFNASSHAQWDSDSAGSVQSLLGNSDYTCSLSTEDASQCSFGFDDMSDAVSDELRGNVTHIPKLFLSAFCTDLIKHILNGWKTTKPANEGFIFHHVRRSHPADPNCFCLRRGSWKHTVAAGCINVTCDYISTCKISESFLFIAKNKSHFR